jgi:integrase
LSFGQLAAVWRSDFVEGQAGGRALVAASTRAKYLRHLQNHILPRWRDTLVHEFRAKPVLDWLQEEGQSWYMMADLRNLMSGIFTKAQEWELLPDSFANPLHRVRLPRKWEVRQKRILSPEQTMRVLARLRDPVLLISQTCLETGARISEVTGLRIQHVDLKLGCVHIEQRHWRGDIDEPKTARSRRTLALGTLRERYRRWIAGLEDRSKEGWVFPQQQDGERPMWDSGVRKALKLAAAVEGCDFAGLRATHAAACQHYLAARGGGKDRVRRGSSSITRTCSLVASKRRARWRRPRPARAAAAPPLGGDPDDAAIG